MKTVTFTAELERSGGKVVIHLPFDLAEVWDALDRYCLRASVNGRMWRGQPARIGDRMVISCGPVWMRDNNVQPGDSVQVEVSIEKPHSNSVAEDVQEALHRDPAHCRRFNSELTTHRLTYLRWIDEAKKPETRQARIEKMLVMLAETKDSSSPARKTS